MTNGEQPIPLEGVISHMLKLVKNVPFALIVHALSDKKSFRLIFL